MAGRPALELKIGSETYRFAPTEDDARVERLARVVQEKYQEIVPLRATVSSAQAMFLTALALADELEDAREREMAPSRRVKGADSLKPRNREADASPSGDISDEDSVDTLLWELASSGWGDALAALNNLEEKLQAMRRSLAESEKS